MNKSINKNYTLIVTLVSIISLIVGAAVFAESDQGANAFSDDYTTDVLNSTIYNDLISDTENRTTPPPSYARFITLRFTELT